MDWKLELVVVPVTDVERARRFHSEQVGFTVDHDTRVDGSAAAGAPSSSSATPTATAGPSRNARPG